MTPDLKTELQKIREHLNKPDSVWSKGDTEALLNCIDRLAEAHEKIVHRFSNGCDCDMTSTDALSDASAILQTGSADSGKG